MYYMTRLLGRGGKGLAAVFALAGGLASFGVGNLAQSCEIAGAMRSLCGWDAPVTGLLLALLTAFALHGGVRRIGRLASTLVPLMAGTYLLAGALVVVLNASRVPALLLQIVRCAFGTRAVGGALCGQGMLLAMRQGLSRGLFSNEAGLGSAPMAHAASACSEPCEQAAWGVFEVLIDSFAVCTVTALSLLLALPDGCGAFATGGEAASEAFSILLGAPGALLVPLSLLLFAFSSILSWSYYGELCWSWLFSGRPLVLPLYRAAFVSCCLLGTVLSPQTAWGLAETLNGLMLLPNLIALLLLSGESGAMCRAYFSRRGQKNNPHPFG